MRDRIIARYPVGGLLLMLLIALVADYLCLDLKFFHYIVFASGVSAHSPWFWLIFGAFVLLTLYCTKQVLHPTRLLVASLSGLEFGHRTFRPPLRIAWEDIREISRGQVEFPSQEGRGVLPAVRFVLNTTQSLGGVTSNMAQVEGNAVSLAACLFDDEVEQTLENLRALRARALSRH